MRVYGSNDLIWKDKDLLLKKPLISILENPTHKGMFWVLWPDGVKSADCYNLTRAKDHAMTIALQTLNNTTLDKIYDGQETPSEAPYVR